MTEHNELSRRDTLKSMGGFGAAALLGSQATSVTPASAASWNEDDDGDLSGDYQNPTVIALELGVNTIRAAGLIRAAIWAMVPATTLYPPTSM